MSKRKGSVAEGDTTLADEDSASGLEYDEHVGVDDTGENQDQTIHSSRLIRQFSLQDQHDKPHTPRGNTFFKVSPTQSSKNFSGSSTEHKKPPRTRPGLASSLLSARHDKSSRLLHGSNQDETTEDRGQTTSGPRRVSQHIITSTNQLSQSETSRKRREPASLSEISRKRKYARSTEIEGLRVDFQQSVPGSVNFPMLGPAHRIPATQDITRKARRGNPMDFAREQIIIPEETTASGSEQNPLLIGSENDEAVANDYATADESSPSTVVGDQSPLRDNLQATNHDDGYQGFGLEREMTASSSHVPIQSRRFDNESLQLTMILLDLLESPETELPDTATLKDAMQYMNRITGNDSSKLRSMFGDSFERYQESLNRWLECVNAFVQFRQITNFEGEKSMWAAFFQRLAPEEKKKSRRAYLCTRSVIYKWLHEPDFAMDKVYQDVAHILLNITSWENMMGLEEMQRLCTTFNERFLEWFG